MALRDELANTYTLSEQRLREEIAEQSIAIIKQRQLDPNMPTQQLLLHCGELTKDEIRLARAVIQWANSAIYT